MSRREPLKPYYDNFSVFKRVSFSQDVLAAGAVAEEKPIGFAGEASPLQRVGPLFYWAWGRALKPCIIAPHDHEIFEIITVCLRGSMRHKDSLGNEQVLTPKHMQWMFAGSGVEHEEELLETGTEFLQIWLEPDFRWAKQQAPQYTVMDFSVGNTHALLGKDAPIQTYTETNFDYVSLSGNQALPLLNLSPGEVVFSFLWQGELHAEWNKQPAQSMREGDVCLGVGHEQAHTLKYKAGERGAELFIMRLPLLPKYAMLPK